MLRHFFIYAWFIMGSVTAATIKQQSAPEAMVPKTEALLLTGPVQDGNVGLELFRIQGEGVEWSPNGRWVAYDCKHNDGYYNIHICRPDGTDDHCLTNLNNGLPHRHAGSPTWRADGQYIAFAAEKPKHPEGSITAIPGFGGYSDIWVMLADGSKAWRLTNTGLTKNDGVIIPKFSRDGKKLSWTERVRAPHLLQSRAWFGDWVIKVADFVDSPEPHLENIHTLEPKGLAFNEGYGFSPDGSKIIFCSDFERRTALDSRIYVMDATDGGNVTCLTPVKAYNEHASFSPDGRYIVWMSNLDNHNGGTDWWIMRADGSQKKRLTHFNLPGYPETCPRPVFACLTHWSSDGHRLLGGIQYSLIKQEGRIVLMTLDPSLVPEY